MNAPLTGEIVGLWESSNGRSCKEHVACGGSLQVGERVMFQATSVIVNGSNQNAIKAVVFRNGRESCTIGILPQRIINE